MPPEPAPVTSPALKVFLDDVPVVVPSFIHLALLAARLVSNFTITPTIGIKIRDRKFLLAG